MIYHYICEKCGNKIDENFPMGNAVDFIKCKCGSKAYQNILAKKVQSHLPEDYIATSEYHSIDYGDDYTMENLLNR